jgi:hypothetical protein
MTKERRYLKKLKKMKKRINNEWVKIVNHYRTELMYQIDQSQVDNIISTVMDRIKDSPALLNAAENSMMDAAFLLLRELALEIKNRFNKRYQTEADLVFARNIKVIHRRIFEFLFNEDYRKSEIEKVLGTTEEEKAFCDKLWFEEFDIDAHIKEIQSKIKKPLPESITKLVDQYKEQHNKMVEKHADTLPKIRSVISV